MSACPEIDTLLRPEAEGRSAIDQHVAQCKGCAAILALDAFRRLPDQPGMEAGCDDALIEIAALAGGTLDDARRQRLAAHLAGCERCRETAVRMTFFAGDLDDVPRLVFPPAAGRVEPAREAAPAAIRDVSGTAPPAVAAEQPRRRPQARTPVWRALLVAAAAVAASMVMLRFVILRDTTTERLGDVTPQTATGVATTGDTSPAASTGPATRDAGADAGRAAPAPAATRLSPPGRSTLRSTGSPSSRSPSRHPLNYSIST